MRPAIQLVIALLTVLWTVSVAAGDTLVRPHPDAPPEMAQFSFLVGEWDCRIKSMDAQGGYDESTARWVGYYTLEGFAFQDDWISPNLRGTTWRSYDPNRKRWVNRWLPANTDQASGFTTDYFYGEFGGGDMVLTAEGVDQGGTYRDRIRFTEITEDSFTWKLDRSRDGGKDWVKDVMIIRARRVK